jgi:hypothetical protein
VPQPVDGALSACPFRVVVTLSQFILSLLKERVIAIDSPAKIRAAKTFSKAHTHKTTQKQNGLVNKASRLEQQARLKRKSRRFCETIKARWLAGFCRYVFFLQRRSSV